MFSALRERSGGGGERKVSGLDGSSQQRCARLSSRELKRQGARRERIAPVLRHVQRVLEFGENRGDEPQELQKHGRRHSLSLLLKP